MYVFLLLVSNSTINFHFTGACKARNGVYDTWASNAMAARAARAG